MRCPACQQATFETATECECGFSLAALDRLLGMAPSFHSLVTDLVGELTRGEQRRALAEAERLGRRFPQLKFSVVVCTPPENISLPLYTFWLFNKAGLASAVERAGMSRMVMLCIDPMSQQAACMIGYGLEPFVSEARLVAAINAAFAGFASDQLGKGLDAYFTELERQLAAVSTALDQSFGLAELEFESLQHLYNEEQAAGAY